MNLFLALVIHTANILGSFNDPFEFQGDYGSEINPIREKVFELVVSKEALSKNSTNLFLEGFLSNEEAVAKDRQHGPTLSELVSSRLIEELIAKQQKLQHVGFDKNDLNDILNFISRYCNQKPFYFFRNNPSELLSLDKILRDQASRKGKIFDLPILSSTATLEGLDSEELKSNLLERLFTEETFHLTKPQHTLQESLASLDQDFLASLLGVEAHNQELQIFCTPTGQVVFYWLYQSLNLHLISQDTNLIEQINHVKTTFAKTLGDPQVRADAFKEKLVHANSGIVFTQESDMFVPHALTDDHLFLSIDKQNPHDGTYIFLRSDLWESPYQVLSIDGYEGFVKGRLNIILAQHKVTGNKFVLASAHGNSTKAEDGRLQISLIMEKFQQLLLDEENEGLQLIIGIDANTKSEEDVKALQDHLDVLGLIATAVGPTTIKQRMVTAQHSKAGRSAIDEEDYLIILKPENGGTFVLTDPTVGFSLEKPDITVSLPNIHNPSDHYPVGATLTR